MYLSAASTPTSTSGKPSCLRTSRIRRTALKMMRARPLTVLHTLRFTVAGQFGVGGLLLRSVGTRLGLFICVRRSLTRSNSYSHSRLQPNQKGASASVAWPLLGKSDSVLRHGPSSALVLPSTDDIPAASIAFHPVGSSIGSNVLSASQYNARIWSA